MSKDSLRGLVQLVSGLGEMTVARANQAARDLVGLADGEGQLGTTELAKQVHAVTQEILKAAEANRAQVAALVRSEVESALARAEVARVVDVDAARATTAALFGQVEDLTNRLLALVPGLSGSTSHVAPARPVPVPEAPSPSAAPARKRPARRSVSTAGATAPVSKAVAKKAPAKKAPVSRAVAKKAPVSKAVAKKAPVSKTTAKKAPVSKTTAKKTPVSKTTAKKTPVSKTTAKKTPVSKTTAKKAPTKKAVDS